MKGDEMNKTDELFGKYAEEEGLGRDDLMSRKQFNQSLIELKEDLVNLCEDNEEMQIAILQYFDGVE
jgi:hypothetical protein